ncbi:MAG: hypothetical protein Q4A06_07415 [Cardiobacteriaceae bacterium]|nr:hypothetical protein [Cardiobacteriaceae bacterium]
MNIQKTVLSLAAISLLGACGGSNDSDMSQPPPPPQQTVSGHIENPDADNILPIHVTAPAAFSRITYKGHGVSLDKAHAIVDMMQNPTPRCCQSIHDDYFTTAMGDGIAAVRAYSGFRHVRFGNISTYDASQHTLSDTVGFYQGIPTASALQEGGAAVYHGVGYQFGKDAEGRSIADYRGSVEATVDFATRIVDIHLRNVSVPVDIRARMTGHSSFAAQQGRLSVHGGLFGLDAEEIGGIIRQDGNGEWTATFAGSSRKAP